MPNVKNDTIHELNTHLETEPEVDESGSLGAEISSHISPRQKFQQLLRKLFQFDCAELDFGIYRIMNQKRSAIERFIEKDLLAVVSGELASGALAQEASLAQMLSDVALQIKENISDEALDAEGNLASEYHGSKLGKQYLALRERAAGLKSNPEQESDIFNHLYTFFSRYYDDGDFMSLRRYSKRDKYAIPYHGEEVHFHWANADQDYVKTGESFTDYSYRYGDWTVYFKLRNADVEQNNVKGARRFFFPRAADAVLDVKGRSFNLPFDYRPLTAHEKITFKSKPQEAILTSAVPKITKIAKSNADALAALFHEKELDAKGNPVSLLDHHLRIYTRKNSSDFFVHRDLKSFLEGELDFYLKNELLNLDDVEMGGESRSDRWFHALRVIRGVARKIIAFAAQIENFQQLLFEKRKFITDIQYCVTLDRVPVDLYAEIAKNKAQVAEWDRLFGIGDLHSDATKGIVDVHFLHEHESLVLDTQFFGQEFVDKLLASDRFVGTNGSIVDRLDGLLIHSDNFQALNLLKSCFEESVQCTYIDPLTTEVGTIFATKTTINIRRG